MNNLPKFRSISVLTLFFFIMNCLLPGISAAGMYVSACSFGVCPTPIAWIPQWPNGGTTIGGGNGGSNDDPNGGPNGNGGGPANPEGYTDEPVNNSAEVADPVLAYTGQSTYDFMSLNIPGLGIDVVIKHNYSSGIDFNNQFGFAWNMNYYIRLKPQSDGSVLVFNGEDGSRNQFTYSGSQYVPPDGVFQSLVHNMDGTWLLTKAHGEKYYFNVAGNITAIEDRNGNQLTFTYDPAGLLPITLFGIDAGVYDYRLIRITDTLGREINLQYDNTGRLSAITDFLGRTVTYTYDPATNDLLSVTKPGCSQYPAGFTYTFTYIDHKLETVTDPKGQVFLSNHYDTEDRVDQQTYGNDTYYLSYNEANNQTSITDRNGHVTTYTFNQNGNVQATEVFTEGFHSNEPARYMTLYGHNSDSLVVTITYPDQSGVLYNYDMNIATPRANGNILSARQISDMSMPSDVKILTTNKTYESNFNQLKTMTDPKGNITTYTYDYELPASDPQYSEKGNLVMITFPEVNGQTPETNLFYDANGHITQIEDQNGNITQYTYYAANGQLHEIIQDPGGINAVTTFTYDTYLNVDTVTDPNGHTTNYDYNEIGWLIQETSPLGYVTQYEYDANGNVTRQERQANQAGTIEQVYLYTYDVLNNVETVTDPLSRMTHYVYDGEENVISVEDPEGNITSYEYDERNLLYRVTDANTPAGVTLYDYNLNGQLAKVTDAKNQSTSYDYDEFGRLLTTTYPDLSASHNEYDNNSNLVLHTLPNGNQIQYYYDALNRVTNKQYPSHPALNVSYTYDLGSRLLSANTTAGNLAFGYDNASRMLSATQTISGLASKTVQYGYDAAGNRTSVTYPSGKIVEYDYDLSGRTIQIDVNSNPLAVFTYDPLDRRELKSFAAPSSLETGYTLDLAGQLQTIQNRINGGGVISQNDYTYNLAGIRQTMTSSVSGVDTYDYNDIYELTSVTGSQTHSYAYDGVGNRATADGTAYTVNTLNQYDAVGAQVITYNTNGNLTNDGVNTYTYDEENRLVTANSASHSASYTYDPFHRRITNTVDGVTVYFVYDGIDVVAEYDASGDLASEYTYSNAIDEVLTMDRGGNTYYYHYDGTGSVTEITDASGSIQESYKYDPYGQPSIFDSAGAPLTTSAIGNRYMYTGREWDAESEIYYYRARMYDPALGRFLQRDPVGYQDSLNLYQYAGNSPTNAFDPMGGRIKWNWGGAWTAIRNNATAAIGTVIVMAVGHYCLPAAAISALSGSLAVKILSLAASAGLAWEAQEVLNRFCSKKLYDDPLTTEMIVNVFIGLGSIGLSLLKAAKAGKVANEAHNTADALKLNKSLGSQVQMSEPGTIMAGPGGRVPFRNAARVAQEYGGSASDWVKKTSTSYTARDGVQFETHWIENIKTGRRVEFKTKLIGDY